LPDNVGVPIADEHGGATYILFQTHYNNPTLEENIRVDWGMDIYYTHHLRSLKTSCIVWFFNWDGFWHSGPFADAFIYL